MTMDYDPFLHALNAALMLGAFLIVRRLRGR